MDEALFTFDSKPFVDAVNKMTLALDVFTKHTEKQTEKVNDTFSDSARKLGQSVQPGGQIGAFLIAKGVLVADVIKAGFNKLRSFVSGGIPEIGRTFSIASDIIQRNFLWPLRQELVPILQKMLNWVRDHRADFVRWGTTLANIFRALMTVVGQIFNLFKTLANAFTSTWEGIFGKSKKTIDEMLNWIIFKVTATVLYITALLKPLFEAIGKIAGEALAGIKGIFDGLADGAKNMPAAVDKIVAQLGRLSSKFGDLNYKTGDFKRAMQSIFDFVSTTLTAATEMIALFLQRINDMVEGVGFAADYIKAFAKGDEKGKNLAKLRMVNLVKQSNKGVDESLGRAGGGFVDMGNRASARGYEGRSSKEAAEMMYQLSKGTMSSKSFADTLKNSKYSEKDKKEAISMYETLVKTGGKTEVNVNQININTPSTNPREHGEKVSDTIKKELTKKGMQ